MASQIRIETLNMENLRRNYAFKNGPIEIHFEKIVKEGTEDKVKPEYILRPFRDVSSILPV